MAYRCDECHSSGPHDVSCSKMNEEIRDEANKQRYQNDELRDLVNDYMGRCPCKAGALCDLCKRGKELTE